MNTERKIFIVGVVLAVVYFVGFIIQGVPLWINAISTAVWFGVPYGWVGIRRILDKMNLMLIMGIGGWIIYFGLRLILAYYTGWIFALCHFGKKIINKKKEEM